MLVCDFYYGASRVDIFIFASGMSCHYGIDAVGYVALCQQWIESSYFWALGA